MANKSTSIFDHKTDPMSCKITKTWRTLIAVQSILSILWLLLIPKEPGNAVFFGFSLRRLILIIPLVFPLFYPILLNRILPKKGQLEHLDRQGK